jgi:hypothetical protein
MNYYQAVNTGLGFITHEDNELAHVAGYPGDIWGTENTTWATRVGAVEKTKEEAQAIQDAIYQEASASYVPGELTQEPQIIVLP